MEIIAAVMILMTIITNNYDDKTLTIAFGYCINSNNNNNIKPC